MVSLADGVATLAAEQGVTPAQLVPAWLVGRGALPIPGTRKAANARANAAAGDLTLDAQVVERLEEIVPPDAVAGAQGNDAYLANLDT
ncbi:aldo/keto reductase [Actinomadura physcomitrii]|uniref:aldo/keto reductase n=1 Tax=Actinomadura physcomitrii TaxID=2650748 RepID=UPI0013692B44|nr:aldo/keto reductase [Actinomadura physcomitrii]